MKLTLIYVLLALILPSATAYPKSTGQYKKEIERNSKSLLELQKNLKEKRLEKEQCLLDEKCIKAEMQKIEKEMSRLQKKGDELKREIRKAERMLAQSEKALQTAGWEKKQWINALNSEANGWYMAHLSHNMLFEDVVEERLRRDAMLQKKLYVGSAQGKEDASRQAIEKWQVAKERLRTLKEQQEATVREQADIKEQKKKLLGTTVGKRIAADSEINKLTETARELEQLIIKLERERKKSTQEAAERRMFREKKKRLPWPVQGEITVKFGRNRHPELDTYIISNGIKIKAAGSSEVRAVSRGEVLFSGEFRTYGTMIILDHGGGFFTIYGQLNEIYVKEAQKVQEGALIGKIGNGHGPVLYFEVRSENKPEDPELWLK